MDVIRVNAVVSPFFKETVAEVERLLLSESENDVPLRVREHALRLFDSPSECFFIEQDSAPTDRTDKLILLINPSNALLELVTTLRVRTGDSDAVVLPSVKEASGDAR